MTITIIGGSGFLGTRLTKRLLDAGHTVRIADKRKSAAYPELWTRCDIRNAPDGIIDSKSYMLYRQHSSNQLGANSGINQFVKRMNDILNGYGIHQTVNHIFF